MHNVFKGNYASTLMYVVCLVESRLKERKNKPNSKFAIIVG